jgi:hypothetical protein
MGARDPDVPAPTRIDRGWLMRHPGTLADEALVLIGKPLHRRRFPRPRPLQIRRPSRLVHAPAI